MGRSTCDPISGDKLKIFITNVDNSAPLTSVSLFMVFTLSWLFLEISSPIGLFISNPDPCARKKIRNDTKKTAADLAKCVSVFDNSWGECHWTVMLRNYPGDFEVLKRTEGSGKVGKATSLRRIKSDYLASQFGWDQKFRFSGGFLARESFKKLCWAEKLRESFSKLSNWLKIPLKP